MSNVTRHSNGWENKRAREWGDESGFLESPDGHNVGKHLNLE